MGNLPCYAPCVLNNTSRQNTLGYIQTKSTTYKTTIKLRPNDEISFELLIGLIKS